MRAARPRQPDPGAQGPGRKTRDRPPACLPASLYPHSGGLVRVGCLSSHLFIPLHIIPCSSFFSLICGSLLLFSSLLSSPLRACPIARRIPDVHIARSPIPIVSFPFEAILFFRPQDILDIGADIHPQLPTWAARRSRSSRSKVSQSRANYYRLAISVALRDRLLYLDPCKVAPGR